MKKQQTIIAALALTIALQANAQNSRGGISSDMLSKIQKEQKLTAADNAIANAIAANAIDDIAKNRKAAADIDTHFSIETPTQSITNQKMLDVQRNERAEGKLRQTHRLAAGGILTGIPLLLRPT